MARTIKHRFVSAIPDDLEPGLVSPNDWNDDHIIVNTPRLVIAAGSVAILITDIVVYIAKTIAEATSVVLPPSATFLGDELFIKDLNGVCNTFAWTADCFAGENCDGISSYPFSNLPYAHLRLFPKSGGWAVAGQI